MFVTQLTIFNLLETLQSLLQVCRVWINVLWFRKYNAFFIFCNKVFPSYPENYDTKITFCFLNQWTKPLFCVKVKNDFNMHMSFFWKEFRCCCLEIWLFSWDRFFCNSFQLHVPFLPWQWHAEDCFTLLCSMYYSKHI